MTAYINVLTDIFWFGVTLKENSEKKKKTQRT